MFAQLSGLSCASSYGLYVFNYKFPKDKGRTVELHTTTDMSHSRAYRCADIGFQMALCFHYTS